MSGESDKKPRPTAGGDEEGDEELDDRLRQLGAEFLDEQVPDSLMDVLRRGLTDRSGRAQPAGSDKQGKTAEPSGDKES